MHIDIEFQTKQFCKPPKFDSIRAKLKKTEHLNHIALFSKKMLFYPRFLKL